MKGFLVEAYIQLESMPIAASDDKGLAEAFAAGRGASTWVTEVELDESDRPASPSAAFVAMAEISPGIQGYGHEETAGCFFNRDKADAASHEKSTYKSSGRVSKVRFLSR